jgi:hypothetical protein
LEAQILKEALEHAAGSKKQLRRPPSLPKGATGLRARFLCVERRQADHSPIVPWLEGPVTNPRIDSTTSSPSSESANLKGLSSTERAHALIGLAHPQFREELTAAAKKLNLI